MRLFHYHLVTSRFRIVEARYVGKLGFDLVSRFGRVGDAEVTAEQGTSWEQLEREGFRVRLIELQRGAVNVVVQPGHWSVPRVDHLGIALDEDDFEGVLLRAMQWKLPVQERGSRRTFVGTNVGYRLEVHPPHESIDELLAAAGELQLDEIQLRADDPGAKADALAEILGLPLHGDSVEVGDTLVRFVSGGPEGRPELYAERFA